MKADTLVYNCNYKVVKGNKHIPHDAVLRRECNFGNDVVVHCKQGSGAYSADEFDLMFKGISVVACI